MTKSKIVTIGFRAKTGRAIAVVLGGTKDAPVVISKTEIKLTDPKIPQTFQPYHEVMDLPWEQSQKAVRTFTKPVEIVAQKAVAKMVEELQAAGFAVKNVAIVGSKDRDLTRIGNYHIRAHAAEGILFRKVLETAAESRQIRTRTFSDRELDQIASAELETPTAIIKKKLSALGKVQPPPWRTDEKQAATAAWLMLGNRR